MLESRLYTPAPNSAMPDIAIATAVSFAIGAIPAAYLIGKLNGINVFEVGTKQAGATNILKTVNRRAGLIVFVLDAGKGVATIYISQTVFNIDISWLWLPSAATVMGHWNSPLTKFRGGDGVASLFGVTAGTFGLAFLLPTLAIGVTMYIVRFYRAHPSFWGGIAGLTSLGIVLAITDGRFTRDEFTAYAGIIVLSALVLAKSVSHHRRHGPFFTEDVEPSVS